jgi:hypothetical protein
VAVAFAAGTVGVTMYLNLKAGASFGWGVLPNSAPHEARDRDYFFVVGFFAWGLWAGVGAATLSRRLTGTPWLALVAAAVPVALNWTAVSRRHEPEASMPRQVAIALLEPNPPDAVLFTSGDNDSYPLWYAQQVLGIRKDVTIVTVPLLGAPWYAEEFSRRHGLGPANVTAGITAAQAIANAARAHGRPVTAALSLPAEDRNRLSSRWRIVGALAVDDGSEPGLTPADSGVTVDFGQTGQWARRIARWRGGQTLRSSLDPVHEYYDRLLNCPKMTLLQRGSSAPAVSLDSLCNLR